METFSGKNNGNQLSMSFDIWSLRKGCMLSPTSPYNIASKYPAKPCKTPACGIWNVSFADRALWLFVNGKPMSMGKGCAIVRH